MAKALPRDSQILLRILQTQKDMQEIIENFGSYEEVAEDKKSFDLLNFYAIKIINLMKNVHSKTKKDAITFLDDFTNKLLLSELTYCYSSVSKVDLVKYFNKISDDSSMDDVRDRYEFCITQSKNYQGETESKKKKKK